VAADEALWGYPSKRESRWPPRGAVVVAITLQATLPNTLVAGPRYVLPALESLLLIVLLIFNQTTITPEEKDLRYLSIALTGVINLANIVSLILLVRGLLNGSKTNGHTLIVAGAGVWLTLVIVFALWYWELDRGGPVARTRRDHGPPDFLFPQMENPGVTRQQWAPKFFDYLYVSLTNCTAFSPTDTLPLTYRAKALMGVQGVASLAAIAVVAARAVNILT
jgi:uncharacterized membrane protein